MQTTTLHEPLWVHASAMQSAGGKRSVHSPAGGPPRCAPRRLLGAAMLAGRGVCAPADTAQKQWQKALRVAWLACTGWPYVAGLLHRPGLPHGLEPQEDAYSGQLLVQPANI